MKLKKLLPVFVALLSFVLICVPLLSTTMAYLMDTTTPYANVFMPDPDLLRQTEASITIRKQIHNTGTQSIGPEGFTFTLRGEGATLTAVTAADGQAEFRLRYGGMDVGQTFHYTLSEVNDGRAYVTYSDVVHHVAITILEEDGELVASVAIDGTAADDCTVEYVNRYHHGDPTIPDTGDPAQLMLYTLMMLVSAAGLIAVGKVRRS